MPRSAPQVWIQVLQSLRRRFSQNGYRRDVPRALRSPSDEIGLTASRPPDPGQGGGAWLISTNQKRSRHAAAECSNVDARYKL